MRTMLLVRVTSVLRTGGRAILVSGLMRSRDACTLPVCSKTLRQSSTRAFSVQEGLDCQVLAGEARVVGLPGQRL